MKNFVMKHFCAFLIGMIVGVLTVKIIDTIESIATKRMLIENREEGK